MLKKVNQKSCEAKNSGLKQFLPAPTSPISSCVCHSKK